MRLISAAVAALVLFSATGLQAWPWSSKRKLPRALDSPIVRPKGQEHHKAGKRAGRHSAANTDARWGTEKSVHSTNRPHQIPSFLLQD
jgi:hypothetical protein